MAYDEIEKPKHYSITGLEPINVIDDWLPHWPWQCGFALANTVKYIARCGLKGTADKDIDKAGWYLRRVVDRVVDYAPSNPRHVNNIASSEAISLWATKWPVGAVDDLSIVISVLSRPVTKKDLVVSAYALESASYHIRHSESQISFSNPDGVRCGEKCRVLQSGSPDVKVGEVVTLHRTTEDSKFEVICFDQEKRVVENVGLV